MGGLAGHIRHLQDDLDLTFSDLRNIVDGVTTGSIKTFEKVDGINIMFTWDESIGEVKVARNQKHVRLGLNRWNIAREFCNNQAMLDTTKDFIATISLLLSGVAVHERVDLFGHSGQNWYSCEIVDPRYFNLINYGQNLLMVHKGIRRYNAKGKLFELNLSKDAEKIFDIFQGEFAGWKLMGPNPFDVTQKDYMVKKKACDAIVGLYRGMAMSGLASQKRWHHDKLIAFSKNFSSIEPAVREICIKSMLGYSGVPTKASILKGFSPKQKSDLQDFWELCKKQISKNKAIVGEIFFQLGKQLMSNRCSGLMISDPQEAVEEMKNLSCELVSKLKERDCKKSKQLLNQHGSSIGSDDIDCCVEGVVFEYKGGIYKLTGIFAPINAINGFFKYSKED